MMTRTLLFAMGGLLLGGIIHIAIILLVPSYSTRDAWTSVGRFGDDNQFHALPRAEPGTEALPYLDPGMAHAVCRFSLGKGPVRMQANLPDTFWSLAVFDRRGRNIYSLNDRSAENSALDLLIATSVQVAELKEQPRADLESSIVIENPGNSGFALLRVFVADPTLAARAADALDKADCHVVPPVSRPG
jgi:uncharacterized membrane protein